MICRRRKGRNVEQTEIVDVQNERKRKIAQWAKGEIGAWMPVILAVLVIILLSKTVWLSATIPTKSMYPTLPAPCFVFSSRVAYWNHAPQRGDIVLFYRDDGDKTIYAKRVIGLPGDVVDIVHGQTYINDEPLDEPYLAETPDPAVELRFIVPEGSYFMMGDNRNHSYDSRYWAEHFVPEENILSRVNLKWVVSLGNDKKEEN